VANPVERGGGPPPPHFRIDREWSRIVDRDSGRQAILRILACSSVVGALLWGCGTSAEGGTRFCGWARPHDKRPMVRDLTGFDEFKPSMQVAVGDAANDSNDHLIGELSADRELPPITLVTPQGIRMLGGWGLGPGEVVMPRALAFAGDTLVVL